MKESYNLGICQVIFALCVLYALTATAWADNAATASQPDANPSTAANRAAFAQDKPVILEKFEVNGLRERMVTRQGTLEKHGWGTLLCLENGTLIDNVVFLCNYKLQHPHELVRLILWQAPGDSMLNANGGITVDMSGRDSLVDGVGPIVNSHHIINIAVYTSGKELHVRAPERGGDHGEAIYPDFSASELRHLSDKALMDFGTPEDPKVFVNGFTNNPDSVAGDDGNLQVYYAQTRLKQIGTTALVVPATFDTSPTNDKMLIFAVYHTFYVWRPYYGAFRLKAEVLAQFGISPMEIAASHQTNAIVTSNLPSKLRLDQDASKVSNAAH